MAEDVPNGEAHVEGAETRKLSPREIYDKSVRSARTIVGTLAPAEMTDDAYSTARALSDMAFFDVKDGNQSAIQNWAERIRTLGDKGKEELAHVYFLGTTLGDESAFDGLRDLLGEEQEAERAQRDQANAE